MTAMFRADYTIYKITGRNERHLLTLPEAMRKRAGLTQQDVEQWILLDLEYDRRKKRGGEIVDRRETQVDGLPSVLLVVGATRYTITLKMKSVRCA